MSVGKEVKIELWYIKSVVGPKLETEFREIIYFIRRSQWPPPPVFSHSEPRKHSSSITCLLRSTTWDLGGAYTIRVQKDPTRLTYSHRSCDSFNERTLYNLRKLSFKTERLSGCWIVLRILTRRHTFRRIGFEKGRERGNVTYRDVVFDYQKGRRKPKK